MTSVFNNNQKPLRSCIYVDDNAVPLETSIPKFSSKEDLIAKLNKELKLTISKVEWTDSRTKPACFQYHNLFWSEVHESHLDELQRAGCYHLRLTTCCQNPKPSQQIPAASFAKRLPLRPISQSQAENQNKTHRSRATTSDGTSSSTMRTKKKPHCREPPDIKHIQVESSDADNIEGFDAADLIDDHFFDVPIEEILHLQPMTVHAMWSPRPTAPPPCNPSPAHTSLLLGPPTPDALAQIHGIADFSERSDRCREWVLALPEPTCLDDPAAVTGPGELDAGLVSWLSGEQSLGDMGFADGGSATEADSDWDEIPDHEYGPPATDSEQPARVSVAAVRSALDARARSTPPPPPPGGWSTRRPSRDAARRVGGRGGDPEDAREALDRAMEQAVEVLFDDMTGMADLDRACVALGRSIAAAERLRGARLPATHVGCRLRAKLRDRIARHLELLSALPSAPASPVRGAPPPAHGRFLPRADCEL